MKPEDLLDPERLPPELKWIATHHRLHPNDPVYLLIAWHWQRVKASEDTVAAKTAELKALLDQRIEAFRACTEGIPGLGEALRTVAERLERRPNLASEAIEKQLEAPMAAVIAQARDVERRLATMAKGLGGQHRRERVATLLLGVALGLIAALAVFGA